MRRRRQADCGAGHDLVCWPSWWTPQPHPNSIQENAGQNLGASRVFPPTLKEMGTKLVFMENQLDRHGWAQGSSHLLLQDWAAFSINTS